MTKAEIQALIDANLADFSNIIPAEHREVESAILNYIPLTIKGTIDDVAVSFDSVGTSHTVVGFVSATTTAITDKTAQITVVMTDAMPDTNYYVKVYLQSKSASIYSDSTVFYPVFKVVNTTTFIICLQMGDTDEPLYKLHVEIV